MGRLKNKNTPLIFSLGNSSIQLDIAAEAFNDYFLGVVEKLSIAKVDIYSALLSLNNSSSQDFPDVIIILITETEIIGTFASLKNKTSSGYDGISNGILKFCGKFLGKHLAYIPMHKFSWKWSVGYVCCINFHPNFYLSVRSVHALS
jgi:hypothetical protein